jgi:hypothetical protein
MFKDLFNEKNYHSYFIEGEPSATYFSLSDYMLENNVITRDNPDNFMQSCESFDINLANQVHSWNNLRSFDKGKRFCVLSFKYINREAEGSLLKILEEPTLGTFFILISSNIENINPTILSRCRILRSGDNNNSKKEWVSEFLKKDTNSRMEMVALLVKKSEDAENSATLRYDAKEICDLLELHLFELFKKNKDTNHMWEIDQIIKFKKYLKNPGSSPKMILESLAMIVD